MTRQQRARIFYSCAALVGRFKQVAHLPGDIAGCGHANQVDHSNVHKMSCGQAQSRSGSNPRKLAAAPSQVFLGLKCGANGWLANRATHEISRAISNPGDDQRK